MIEGIRCPRLDAGECKYVKGLDESPLVFNEKDRAYECSVLKRMGMNPAGTNPDEHVETLLSGEESGKEADCDYLSKLNTIAGKMLSGKKA